MGEGMGGREWVKECILNIKEKCGVKGGGYIYTYMGVNAMNEGNVSLI